MAKKTNKTIKELSVALVKHADDLQMFANGVSMDAYSDFEQTEEAILLLLYRLYEEYAKNGLKQDYKTLKYFEALKERIEEIRNNFFDDEEVVLKNNVKNVTKNENKFLLAYYSSLTGLSYSSINSETTEKIAKYGIYNGGTIDQIFEESKQSDTKRIYEAMVNSIRSGMTIEQAREQIQKEFNKSKRDLKTNIDSIVNGVTNDVALSFASKNKTKLMYSASLDNRVCSSCKKYDGQIFSYNDEVIPTIPQHYNCRCRWIPIPDVNDDFSGLNMTFKDYYSTMNDSEKESRVGSIKKKGSDDGIYNLKDYEAPMPEQRLTINELKKRDISSFA